MNLFRAKGIVVAALALLLQACAGGGETGTGLTNGSGGNDVSVGTITAFGSVWVNGVEFETTSSVVKLEGANSLTNALKLGMVVTVKGKINVDGVSGIADQILVEEVIKGQVTAKGTSSFTVLGQEVFVNETTLFEDGLTLGSLDVGNYVEVSGIVKSAGAITATRVERKTSLSAYKLKGVASSTDPIAKTFTIGTLTVDYSNITGLPAGVPADDLLVEVKGLLSDNILVATSLEAETLDVEDADQFEIEGYVGTVSNGGASFTVNNVTIQTSGVTEYSAGLIADLVPGVFVEVEGVLQGGIVSASEVKFREGVKLESYVTAKTADTLTLDGIGGLTVSVNSETEFSGVTGIGDIALNTDRVSVRGRYAGANTVVATRIEVEASADLKVVLQGPVDALTNPTLTLMGISVNTAGISSFGGDGVNDQTSFFATVSVGDVVNVEGTLSGGVVTWESIELED